MVPNSQYRLNFNYYEYNCTCGQINKIILQRYDIFKSWSRNFDTEIFL